MPEMVCIASGGREEKRERGRSRQKQRREAILDVLSALPPLVLSPLSSSLSPVYPTSLHSSPQTRPCVSPSQECEGGLLVYLWRDGRRSCPPSSPSSPDPSPSLPASP